ncbi:MAG: triphosphoribosyl-dephospho-CoA synthase [Hyphomicrobiales bacterium]|nr:triphosphoribosyl-dephospho-CoA synthase [Hyphomicrobiales bacterium]
MDIEAAIGAAFEEACRDELEAPKPGNVHVLASGHAMTVEDFRLAARSAAPFIATRGARIGARISGSVGASLQATGQNINLGIILLCAPLAAAAEKGNPDLHAAVGEILEELDLADARLAFAAIVRAAPGGLGDAARHDVRSPPTVSLGEAMAEAASRDRIARQYANGFADIFDVGLPALRRSLARGAQAKLATVAVYLTFLSAFPDTHIERKQGAAEAERVTRRAKSFFGRLEGGLPFDELESELIAWDGELKRAGINPGTSADLTVATLFAAKLQSILQRAGNSG